ncbi:MAG: TolC family protein [Deltaproteobacteria bacterium]|nr:TolC family protein [Deltaproteobacteria bacterium]
MNRLIALTLLICFVTVGVGAEAKVYTLKSCKAYALKNNRKIKEKKIELEAAEQVKKDAFTNYFPKVEASAYAMKASSGLIEGEIPEMNLPVYDGNPANLQNPTQFTYFPGMKLDMLDEAKVLAITAIQPLYAGGRIVNGNKLAALGVTVSRQQIELTESDVVVETETYFWTIVALEEKQKTISSYEALLINLQKDAQNAYDAGLVQKSDVLKVQLKLNEVRTQSRQLKNGIEILRQNLCLHMGVPYDRKMVLQERMGNITAPETLFRKKKEALNDRMEYQMLKNAVEAEKLQKKMVRGEMLPEVFVGAQATAVDILDNKMTRGILFAGVNVPISAWWGGYHRTRAHSAQVEVAENRLDETSELLQLQMEKAYRDFLDAYEQIDVATLAVRQSEQHLKVVKDNYDAGIMNMSDLLEAEAMFQEAKVALVDAQTEYKMYRAQYLKATNQNQ